MKIQIIQVPYDSGHKSVRTGRGPDHFLQRRIDQILRNHGHEVMVHRIESDTSFRTALIALKNNIDSVYLHIDMDVLDTGQAQPNHLAVPGGLPVEIVEDAIRMVKEQYAVSAFTGTFSGFQPILLFNAL